MQRMQDTAGYGWYYAIAVVAVLLPQFYFYPHITDDAFITFRYVERWITGYGLTFNPGERVEGFSSPLWVIVLGGATSLGFDILDASRIIGILATLIASFLVIRYLQIRSASTSAIGVALAILLATPGLHYYASSGMETPLVMMLLILAVYSWERDRLYLSALAIGLAAITRPEIALHLVLWSCALFASGKKQRSICMLVAVLPLACWMAFRLVYYESWIPNTALAKSGGFSPQSVSSIIPFILSVLGPLGLILGWKALRRDRVQVSDSLTLAALFVVASVIFVFYAPLDWMSFGRFFMPALPMLAILAGYIFREDLFSLQLHPRTLAISFAILTILVWLRPLKQYAQNEEMAMLMRSYDQRAVGEYLCDSISAGSTIATGRLGAVSYMAPDLIFWDFMGLTDKEVASYKARGGAGENPIIARNPDHMLHVSVPEAWSYEHDTVLMQHMRSNYSLVREFPQGNFGKLHLWSRK